MYVRRPGGVAKVGTGRNGTTTRGLVAAVALSPLPCAAGDLLWVRGRLLFAGRGAGWEQGALAMVLDSDTLADTGKRVGLPSGSAPAGATAGGDWSGGSDEEGPPDYDAPHGVPPGDPEDVALAAAMRFGLPLGGGGDDETSMLLRAMMLSLASDDAAVAPPRGGGGGGRAPPPPASVPGRAPYAALCSDGERLYGVVGGGCADGPAHVDVLEPPPPGGGDGGGPPSLLFRAALPAQWDALPPGHPELELLVCSPSRDVRWVSSDTGAGVVVGGVRPGSAAAVESRLRPGLLLVSVDGVSVRGCTVGAARAALERAEAATSGGGGGAGVPECIALVFAALDAAGMPPDAARLWYAVRDARMHFPYGPPFDVCKPRCVPLPQVRDAERARVRVRPERAGRARRAGRDGGSGARA